MCMRKYANRDCSVGLKCRGWKVIDACLGEFCKNILRIPACLVNGVAELEWGGGGRYYSWLRSTDAG